MERYHVEYGGKIIEFTLERKNVKNVNLHIRPDMQVCVSANKQVPVDFILKFVKEKAPWIIKNVEFFKGVQPEAQGEKEFVSGESFKYLGKQYRLRVLERDSEDVKYYRGFIYLYVRDTQDTDRKRSLFNEWLRQRAEVVFSELLEKVYSLVQKYDVPKPEIKIRTMKARWGSCLKESQSILLNFELIKAPKYCIEYVILHELLHFIHKNHDNRFYSFQSVLMPDWKIRKEILDGEIVREL